MWTEIHANEAIRKGLDQEFPGEDIRIAAWEVSPDRPIRVAPQHNLGEDGRPLLFAYEEIPQEHLVAIGNLVVNALVGYERQALADFRARLEKCKGGLSEFRARPPMLSEFMTDITDLYGMVIETDISMLMASDHFSQIATEQPKARIDFARNQPSPMPGAWGIPFQYASTAEQLVGSYSMSGRNRILRNRSVIIFLYELWDHRYRPAIAAAVGVKDDKDIISDIFGDLRIYRNRIAHGRGVLDRRLKVLPFVEVGGSIDLVTDMDDLFKMVVAELNRLSREYFAVVTNFSFENILGGVVIASGPSWQSDHRALRGHDVGEGGSKDQS